MRIIPVLAAILLLTITVSCKKEMASVHEKPGAVKNEFDSCNCSALTNKNEDGEYIKANFNGVPVCFDQVPNMNDTFPNMLKHGFILRDTGNQYYDNLYMIRNAVNSHWQAALFLENSYALTKTYPYRLPRANSEVCEIGELQINDVDHYTSCTLCPENDFNYYCPFFETGLELTVNSFNNNIFEGVFSGRIVTGSGRMVSVTNGKFRIKLIVFRSDINVNN